jgi:hypothetical protein
MDGRGKVVRLINRNFRKIKNFGTTYQPKKKIPSKKEGIKFRIRRFDDLACLIFHRDGRLFNGLEMFSLGQNGFKTGFQ